MYAIGFNQPHAISSKEALQDIEVPTPTLAPFDILVEVHAVSVNPAETKIRHHHTPKEGEFRILGYDAAGVVVKVGEQVTGFEIGDKVYYAGAIDKAGTNSEFHAVDSRLVAKMPKTLDYTQAAALPLTILTAWEVLFERLNINANSQEVLLIIGGAGGVGSVAIQLAKALTKMTVVATASRDESVAWCYKMGADFVINHHHDLAEQLQTMNIVAPTFVFSTTHSDTYLAQIAKLIAPQGKFALIDDPKVFDITPFKSKSVSVHWEFMFTRSLYQTSDMAAQGEILAKAAKLIERGQMVSTLNQVLSGMNAKTLIQAHALIESGRSIGKLVVTKTSFSQLLPNQK